MQKTEKARSFSGPFANLCKDYIQKNRALGYKYFIEETYLLQFDTFCIGKSQSGQPITKELFDQWTTKIVYESPTTHKMRFNILARFCKFLNESGRDTYTGFYPIKREDSGRGFAPYIFNKDEIARFFQAADSVKASNVSPQTHIMLPVLFRMLYSCGLRLSEVLNLTVADVDFKKGVLAIRDSKFDKSRLIPMSESMLAISRVYANTMHSCSSDESYFFPAPDKGPFAESSIYTRFRRLLFEAGISHGGRGKGPRLHDFRHTFAVHSLRKLVADGRDIYVTLPILCGYLGHKSIGSTQYYLRLTAEVYPELTEAFEMHFGAVFPEVRK